MKYRIIFNVVATDFVGTRQYNAIVKVYIMMYAYKTNKLFDCYWKVVD